jgi:hypothetical protein
MLTLLHRLFQLLLVIAEQGMDFAMCFLADGVDLRSELLARSVWILIEQRLNPVVVLLEQGLDLPLLFSGQFEIPCQAREFLIDGLRCMDMRKQLTCRGLLSRVILRQCELGICGILQRIGYA